MDHPDDADGDALRRIARHSDMSQPIDIEFAVSIPTKPSQASVADAVGQRGYSATVQYDDVSGAWTVYGTKRMVPTYAGVVAAQAELDELSAPFGGYVDGWGTFGT